MTWAKRAGIAALVLALGIAAVQAWHGARWLANELSATPIWHGDAALEKVTRFFAQPWPEGAIVVAVSAGGFQDPYAQIRIDAPRAAWAEMLVFLDVAENDLRVGAGWAAQPFIDHPEWFHFPSDSDDMYGDLQLGSYDWVALHISRSADPTQHDIYLLHASSM